jgi:hypothetical protein
LIRDAKEQLLIGKVDEGTLAMIGEILLKGIN